MHRAPRFWFEQSSWRAALLAPLGFCYAQITALAQALTKPEKMPVPVICIGNVTLGGAGKTPVVASLAAQLQKLGHTPHIISRGYGGAAQGPVQVDPALHHAGTVGDEPLLLAQTAPTWVAKNKVMGARAAIAAGATIILLDDGLQNNSLYKNFSFLVIDGLLGLGNEQVFPAGPLREDFSAAYQKAHVVVITSAAPSLLLERLGHDKPVLKTVSETFSTENLQGKNLYAFSGIAHPDKFFKGLTRAGALIKGAQSFPDHHRFSNAELAAIKERAARLNAVPATTMKDAMRLTSAQRQGFLLCALRLIWQDEAALINILADLK